MHTQPPVQWIRVVISPGVKRLSVKLTTHFYLVPRLGMAELYLHFPIRVLGI
jgi:hypothetical protein